MADWEQTLFSGLTGFFGGLLGAIIAVRATNRQSKFQLTRQKIEKFENLIEKIEDSYTYLRDDVDVENGYFDKSLCQENEAEAERRYNIIADVGNFFQDVSELYYQLKIEKCVDDGAIYEAIEQFANLCAEKQLKVTTPGNLHTGRNWEDVWPHIRYYLERKRAKWPLIKSYVFG